MSDLPERWRSIVGWPLYQISSLGRVRSEGRYVRAVHNSLAFRKGRILQPVVKGGRYLAVTLVRDTERRQFFVHDLVTVAFIGPKPVNQQVRHGARGLRCNEEGNLCYGTLAENVADREPQGEILRGQRHGMSRLTDGAVRDIRASRMGNRLLAQCYGVSMSHIWSIKKRRVWRHI